MKDIAEILGLGEFLPDTIFSDIITDLFCDPILLPPLICESVIFILCGYDPDQMNETLLERITYHTPAGTSTYTVVQYAQEVAGGFHKYDTYENNMDNYGVDTPPEYYPANSNVPVSIYWGQNDWLADPSVSYHIIY